MDSSIDCKGGLDCEALGGSFRCNPGGYAPNTFLVGDARTFSGSFLNPLKGHDSFWKYDLLRKVQGRLMPPVIGQLAEKYPHVTTYKVDIDKEGLGNALTKLNIHSALHFFQGGKKASEVGLMFNA